MKKNLTFIAIIIIAISSFAQTTKTIDHDGLTREYIEYIPSNYNASNPASVIFCLHGLGDNMTNFSNIGMYNIADTANIIVITPQAILAVMYGYEIGTAWNSGASYNGMTLNPTVDDIGFIMAILTDLHSLYNIDDTRIYATGFSMGGFMCNRIASELNSTFTAIASVSGTIGGGLTMAPANPIPVIHFHGTADSTVMYHDNTYGNDPEELVEYWRNFNNCDSIPIIDSIPDSVNDGKTVVHYSYLNGDSNTDVEFFKIIGGEHEWIWAPQNDIDYTHEIWKFLSRYTKTISSINKIDKSEVLNIYPNPTNNILNIEVNNNSEEYNVQIFNELGIEVYKINSKSRTLRIETRDFNNGIYYIKTNHNKTSYLNKFVVLH